MHINLAQVKLYTLYIQVKYITLKMSVKSGLIILRCKKKKRNIGLCLVSVLLTVPCRQYLVSQSYVELMENIFVKLLI